MSSIFTKIINREISQEIVFEDESVIVILTIEPLTPGHMLVIPKQEVEVLWDLPDDTYVHLMSVVKTMARHLRRTYPEYKRIGSVVEGFGVPHAHVHVFGYVEPLNETVTRHIEDGRPTADAETLKREADTLRALPIE